MAVKLNKEMIALQDGTAANEEIKNKTNQANRGGTAVATTPASTPAPATPAVPKPVENTTTTTTTTPTQTTTSTTTSPTPAVNKTPVYTPAILPTYTAQTERVDELYDAALELQKAQLQNAYDKNVLAYEGAREKIAPTYQQERNAVAAESEKQKQAFNEYAAASGLNTGAGSQVELARSNQLQGNLSALRRAEADAQTELDMKLAELKVDYQNAVAQAIAQNDYEKAAALLEEYKLEQQSIVSVAQAQANENYKAYAAQVAYEQEQYNRKQAEIEAKATQLYRDQQTALAKAQTLAQYGDFSGYAELGYDTSAMQALYDAQLSAAQTEVEREAAQAYAEQLAELGNYSGYLALGWSPETVAYMQDAYRAKHDEYDMPNVENYVPTYSTSGGYTTEEAMDALLAAYAGSSNPLYAIQVEAEQLGYPREEIVAYVINKLYP